MIDATSSTWVCQSSRCGQIYAGNERFCPVCGTAAQLQRSVRRRGAVMVAGGLLLFAMIGALTWLMLPTMLAAGREVDGWRYSGTPGDTVVILGLFGAVALVGLGALVAGYIQLRHGRQNWPIVWARVGVVGAIYVAAWLMDLGVLLGRP